VSETRHEHCVDSSRAGLLVRIRQKFMTIQEELFMPKHLYVAAAVALALAVSACGRDDNRDTAPAGPTSSTNTNTGGPSSPTAGPLITGETPTTDSSAMGGTAGSGRV